MQSKQGFHLNSANQHSEMAGGVRIPFTPFSSILPSRLS
jgi:hypothetical protein